LNVYGGAALRALGTSLEPVWITSIKDDEHGGDTNADAGATVPAPGDWRAIDCYGGSSAEFEETWLAYGGWSDTDNLHSASGSMDALNWTGGGSISSASRGMRVTADVIDLKRVRIADNASDGARIGASVSATLDSCDIYDNAGQGVRSDVTSPMIDATDCWWGDATGPYDPTDGNPDYNPGGLGDEVSDWVIYRPWLGSPTANLPPVSFALLTPAAGDTVITDSVFFSWETAPDPNGDPVTYELWVDVSPAFPMPESVLVVSGLTDTTYTHMGSDFDNFTAYYWVVFAHDDQDESRRSTPVYRSFFTEPEDAGVPGTHRDERALEVYPVGPNPSRSASTLRFSLREAQSVRIEIVDVTGRRVRVLHDGMLPAGSHKIGWNGLNDQGIGAASGVFFYRVIAESGTETRRAVLIR
jgi:hypothetical protein